MTLTKSDLSVYGIEYEDSMATPSELFVKVNPFRKEQPENKAVKQTVHRHDTTNITKCKSHSYDKGLADASEIMIRHLQANKADAESLAVIFDIDDTVLYTEDRPDGNTYTLRIRLLPMYMVYETAIKLKYKVFFVTARPDVPISDDGKLQNSQYTEAQLASAKFNKYNGLVLMPFENDPTFERIAKYKRNARLMILESYPSLNGIILTAGDQWSDLLDPSSARAKILACNYDRDVLFNLSSSQCYIIKDPETGVPMGAKLPSF